MKNITLPVYKNANGFLTTSSTSDVKSGDRFTNYEVALEMHRRGLCKDPSATNWKEMRKNLCKKDVFKTVREEMNAGFSISKTENELMHTAVFLVSEEKDAAPHISEAISAFLCGLGQLSPLTHKPIVIGYKIA